MNNEISFPTWLEGLGVAGYLFVVIFVFVLMVLWIIFPMVVISQLGRLRKIERLLEQIKEHTIAQRVAAEEMRSTVTQGQRKAS